MKDYLKSKKKTESNLEKKKEEMKIVSNKTGILPILKNVKTEVNDKAEFVKNFNPKRYDSLLFMTQREKEKKTTETMKKCHQKTEQAFSQRWKQMQND